MDEKMRILLCEDDENLGMLLREYLQAKGYTTELCPDGECGYKAFIKDSYDLCILDVMMPKKDGFTLAQEIRNANSEVPIIFLTAKALKEDILEGFKIGADDYITKPFETSELLARIRAILRRQRDYAPDILQFGKLVLNRSTYELSFDDKVTTLGNKEFLLMEIFMSKPKHVIPTPYMIDTVWSWETDMEMNVVWVYISHLRKKLQSINANIEIRAKRGVGYSLEEIDK